MTDLKQYAVSILLIVAIATVDKYIIVESTPAHTNMVWIDGSDFTTSTEDNFSDRDSSQDFQLTGFWIDESVVSQANYQEFLTKTGYVSLPNVEPEGLIISSVTANLASADFITSHKPQQEQVFALRGTINGNSDEENLQYISATDALTYCNWKGMDLSSREQNMHMMHKGSAPSHAASAEITLHAAHPMSNLSGFRCAQLAK